MSPITKIITPFQASNAQIEYCRKVEREQINNLIDQFNFRIACQQPGQTIYVLQLFYNRPAAFYDDVNIKNKFIEHCENSGWNVKSIVIDECRFTVTVSPNIL